MTDQIKTYRIRLKDLDNEFITGNDHFKEFVPVSSSRIRSYKKNPRAQEEDVVLIYACKQQQMIAFRTLLPDHIVLKAKLKRFAWCSGSWVHPNFRRQGLASKLLGEALDAWDGKLAFTNYAPESLKVYEKAGVFKTELKRTGARFYLNAPVQELLGSRHSGILRKGMLVVVSGVYKFLQSLKAITFRPHSDLKCEENTLDIQHLDTGSSLFQRTSKELRWISNAIWLTSAPVANTERYPFSWYEKSFSYICFSVGERHKKASSFLLVSDRGGNLKTLYWKFNDADAELLLKQVVNYMHRKQSKMLTTYDAFLAEKLRKIRNPFVLSKPFSMNIYATFALDKNAGVFDGDGDTIFT